jgi:hypothetical protein
VESEIFKKRLGAPVYRVWVAVGRVKSDYVPETPLFCRMRTTTRRFRPDPRRFCRNLPERRFPWRRCEHVGEWNSALLLEDCGNGVGAFAAEFLVERGAADCRGVSRNLKDVGGDALGLLGQLHKRSLILGIDGDFAVAKVNGGFAEDVVLAEFAEAFVVGGDGGFVGGDLLLLGGELGLLRGQCALGGWALANVLEMRESFRGRVCI